MGCYKLRINFVTPWFNSSLPTVEGSSSNPLWRSTCDSGVSLLINTSFSMNKNFHRSETKKILELNKRLAI